MNDIANFWEGGSEDGWTKNKMSKLMEKCYNILLKIQKHTNCKVVIEGEKPKKIRKLE